MPVTDPSFDSAARPDPVSLDAAALLQLHALDPLGNERLFERMASAFELLIQRLLPALDSALQNADPSAIEPVAHTLKSAAAALGAKTLAADCAVIESLVRTGRQDDRHDDLFARVQRLRDDLPGVRAAVRALTDADPRAAARPLH